MLRLFEIVKNETPILIARRVQVYCQYCGKDLTAIGGEVTNTKRIYCPKPESETENDCSMRDLYKHLFWDEYIFAQHRSSQEIQEDIRKRRLTHYSGKIKDFIRV